MDYHERIMSDSEIMAGKPTMKGTRLTVDFVIKLMEQGWNENEIIRNYPGLTQEDILGCRQFDTTNENPQPDSSTG